MEYGEVMWMCSSQYKNDLAVYKSVLVPGCVYKFFHKRDTEYCCCRCRELGKWRSIRIVNNVVVGHKNPEEDHHKKCVPLDEKAVRAKQADRNICQEIRSNGKRPRPDLERHIHLWGLSSTGYRSASSKSSVVTYNWLLVNHRNNERQHMFTSTSRLALPSWSTTCQLVIRFPQFFRIQMPGWCSTSSRWPISTE